MLSESVPKFSCCVCLSRSWSSTKVYLSVNFQKSLCGQLLQSPCLLPGRRGLELAWQLPETQLPGLHVVCALWQDRKVKGNRHVVEPVTVYLDSEGAGMFVRRRPPALPFLPCKSCYLYVIKQAFLISLSLMVLAAEEHHLLEKYSVCVQALV